MESISWRPSADNHHLRLRAEIVWSIREFFHRNDIWEVHTPTLSHDTVIDRHIDPIVVSGRAIGLPQAIHGDFYLQTSPEFGMKRLLAAGMDAIYQIAPVFRAAEMGQFHNPEFMMVEWYRTGDNLSAAVELLSELVTTVLKSSKPEVLTYQSAFQRYAQCDPLEDSMLRLSQVALAGELGVDPNWSDDRDDWLNLLFSELVQPRLGWDGPLIVTHYPASQSALAQIAADNPQTAERFELFVQGVELANGYHELLDAAELVARNQRVLAQRSIDGKSPLPEESWLLDAMRAGLPACSGCAMGLDRLVMVATQAASIDEVIAFPITRA